LNTFIVFIVTYVVIIFFSIVSEITYKKREFTAIIKDFKKIAVKSALILLILLVFTLIRLVVKI